MNFLQKLFWGLSALGGGPVAAQPAAPAVLRGRVLHPTDSVVFLARPRNLLDLTPVFEPVRVNPQGEFQVVLDSLPRPLAAQWGLGRPDRMRHYTDLWLTPGDTLTLTVDARRFTHTLRFAGPGAAVNYYRAAQRRAHTDNFYNAPEGRPEPRNPARVRALADHYRQRAEAVLRAADHTHPLPPPLRRQEAAAIRYDWGHALLTSTHRYEYGRWPQNRLLRRMPEAYYRFLSELPLPQDSLLAHPAYRLFVHSHASYLLRERRQRMPFAAFVAPQFSWAYDTVRQVLPAGATRQYLLAQVLNDLLRHGIAGDFDARLADFEALGATPELRAALRQRAGELAGTRPQQPAPTFGMTDPNGRPVRWTDLQGKLVYVDVWASWCKPCRADAPALRALQLQFAPHASQLVFVSLSIDTNAAAWRRAVAADHLAEAPNQLQVLGRLADPALRHLWEQRGVPQCWLIGPDGLIIDANAPHPSNPAAPAALEALLKARFGHKPAP
ncbi:TlpA family protein disulfide reductase [Hymenobacter sp. 5317J-9]|uniref:TlpA family protein disulfide reductase n=1 Tax=Hymenobacter sp. 5317J-9 TaxID=2932250 RepID=UPI001FD6F67A|nr:TlpA disulfide reductase family protein [Hymenobacter sp. 5317J-9]UOQ99361.1 TlpA family protein disulfide reductase [Hymenobacter sp. 5317J-9]